MAAAAVLVTANTDRVATAATLLRMGY